MKHDIVIRSYSAYSIRDRGNSLTKNPDVWLQSLPSQNHRLKAWQKWVSMYGKETMTLWIICLGQKAADYCAQSFWLIHGSVGPFNDFIQSELMA